MDNRAKALWNLHLALVALNRAVTALNHMGLKGEARSIARHCEKVRSRYLILMVKEEK